MSDIAIRIEGLGKRYRYGGVAPLSANLRADITEWARGVFRRRRSPQSSVLSPQLPTTDNRQLTTENSPSPLHPPHSTFREVHERHLAEDPNYFWALRDINLEIKQGEVVGLIGRNGAGKSTLLKILARITAPTAGRVTYYGRVASLLEVGTGFHRELTGRENIFLNGSILGMSRADIARKFDEIIAFAEVENFVDTPVKFYSSGMYVRLAFAVAAHLETDIMLVDEVLAVGDAAFQQKCLGKMDAVAKTGRTVIFVSHNMGTIQTLCPRAALLRNGQVGADGPAREVTQLYLRDLEGRATEELTDRKDRRGTGATRATALNLTGKDSQMVITGQPMRMELTVSRLLPTMTCAFTIYSPEGHQLAFFTTDGGVTETRSNNPPNTFVCEISPLLLLPGRYRINVALYHQDRLADHVESASVLEVHQGTVNGAPTARLGGGDILLPHRWYRPAN